MGNLGFMADIAQSDVYPALQALLRGDYNIEKRIMMEGNKVVLEK